MAKEIAGFIKLQIKGGAANPSPPVGPALGSKGINIMDFCKQFNARTQEKAGKILPVVITYYADKSFPNTQPPHQCYCSAESDPPPKEYLLCGGPLGVLTTEEQGKRGLTKYAEKQMDYSL